MHIYNIFISRGLKNYYYYLKYLKNKPCFCFMSAFLLSEAINYRQFLFCF